MRHQDPDIIHAEPGAAHRREDVRNAVEVHALMQTASGFTVPCAIVDVSSTGMALEIKQGQLDSSQQPFKPGMTVSVRFSPGQTSAPEDMVTAPTRIMWTNRRSVGVRFETIAPALNAALREVVRAAVEVRLQRERPADADLSIEQRRTLKACRKTLQKQVPNIVWTIRKTLARRLQARAAERGADAQEATRDAALLEEKATAIGLTVEHRFIASFAEVFGLEQTQELTVDQVRAALIEGEAEVAGRDAARSDAKEDDRLLLRVVEEVTKRHGANFLALEKRFQRLLDDVPETVSNPLSPANACRTLWQAVTDQCPSIAARQALETVMLSNAVPLIGELYAALERTMDEQAAGR